MESIWSVCHLDAGWVVVDHVEDVDQAEQDGDQQTHPASNNLPRANLSRTDFFEDNDLVESKIIDVFQHFHLVGPGLTLSANIYAIMYVS